MNENVGKTEDVENTVNTENIEEALEDDVEDLVEYENIEEVLGDIMNENNVQTEDVEETVNKHTDKTGDGGGTFEDRMNMDTV